MFCGDGKNGTLLQCSFSSSYNLQSKKSLGCSYIATLVNKISSTSMPEFYPVVYDIILLDRYRIYSRICPRNYTRSDRALQYVPK